MDRTFFLDTEFVNLISDRYKLALVDLDKDTPDDQKQYLPSHTPSLEQIRSLIEVPFWASLIKEEGRFNGFSIIFSPPEKETLDDPFIFKASLPFTPEQLAKLAPALQPQSVTIGVWPKPERRNPHLGIHTLSIVVAVSKNI